MAKNLGAPNWLKLAKLVLTSKWNVFGRLACHHAGAAHLIRRSQKMFHKLSIALTIALLATAVTAFAAEREEKKGRVLKASETIGLPVVNRQDEELGEIHDLVVSPTGARLSHIVVSTGGVLGIGDTLRPVPIEAAHFLRRGED
jgi:sporulation protein YlmC with PRC-barrel domain